MNIFYSMSWLEDITFHKILPLLLFFQTPYCYIFVLKGVHILYVTSTITVQYLCKSFKIQLCNGAVLYFFNFFNYFCHLIASLKLFPFATFLLLFYKWNFLYKWKKPKISLKACFLYTVLVYLQIFYEVSTKSQIPKIIIPIITIIIVNLSLINNKNVIKSLEMTSNSKHRTNSKYGEHRKRKN